MRILITGSSGQIGTNLALRLVADGHEVFGVDKRQNTWTDAFRYLLQDLSGDITGVEFEMIRFQQSLTFTDSGSNRSEDQIRAIREACRGQANPAGLDDPRCRR